MARATPKRRFEAKRATAMLDLRATMAKMRAENLWIGESVSDGRSVELTFDRNGKHYVARCSKWHYADDNLRAIEQSITLSYRAVELLGVTREEAEAEHAYSTPQEREAAVREAEAVLDRQLLWAEATPADVYLALGDGKRPWHKVLHVREDASPQEVKNAYLGLVRTLHPDNPETGDGPQFRIVKGAYEEAQRALRARGMVLR